MTFVDMQASGLSRLMCAGRTRLQVEPALVEGEDIRALFGSDKDFCPLGQIAHANLRFSSPMPPALATNSLGGLLFALNGDWQREIWQGLQLCATG
jgi:hypothetical protein